MAGQPIALKFAVWVAALLSPWQALSALDCPCRHDSAAICEPPALATPADGCCRSLCCGAKKVPELKSRSTKPEPRAKVSLTITRTGYCSCPEGCTCEQHHAPSPMSLGSTTTPNLELPLSHIGSIAIADLLRSCQPAIVQCFASTILAAFSAGVCVTLCRLTV